MMRTLTLTIASLLSIFSISASATLEDTQDIRAGQQQIMEGQRKVHMAAHETIIQKAQQQILEGQQLILEGQQKILAAQRNINLDFSKGLLNKTHPEPSSGTE